MNNKEQCMRRVQIYDFALWETQLFLDTHPEDEQALAAFSKYKQLRDDAVREYVLQCGPIVSSDQKDESTWQWVKSPWPWEMEDRG